ncbi:MAG TPA: Crp/Fnr family transcriptional regulator [Candidatus Dormibacteraeota bacterium]|nr:Crp/Fnr family transcriptional regulator [Candidatus Dormibacteraeota bacterium]
MGTKVGQDVPQSAVRSVDAAVDDLELLAGTLLFEGLSTTELEVLRPAIRSRSFARDAYVFREGDPGSHLYVVVRGRVKIARFSVGGGEVVFALVGPGEMFGELSLFAPDGERTADAQALEAARCLAVNRDAVVSLLLGHPDVLFKMISWLTAYIRRKDAAIAEAAFLDIPARVGLKLVELAQSKGNRVSGGVLIDVPLSQRTLAGMVGASRENVNRALNRFVALGFIRKSRGRITVLQPDQLRRRGLARM